MGTSKEKTKGCCKPEEAKTAAKPCPETQPKPAKKGPCCSKPTK